MAKKYYSTLTKIGLNAIARATTMNEKVKFSKFCIGDAEIHPDVTTTALGHEVWQGSLSSIVVDENNSNWIVLTCIISATVGGFTIREVGIKDEDGNLLAVASYPETYKPVLAEGAGKDLIVRVILEVSNTEVVELKIDPTVTLATRSDLEAIENKKANKEEVKKLEEKVEKVEQKVTEGVENLDVAGKQIEFEEASTRTLPKTGDTLKMIISKLTKFLSDLKKVAFTGKYSDLTSIPTSFPPAEHNHDDRYLGKSAKAANSEKLDGHDSSHFATAEKLQEVFQSAVDGKQIHINEINKALGSDSGLTINNSWMEIANFWKNKLVKGAGGSPTTLSDISLALRKIYFDGGVRYKSYLTNSEIQKLNNYGVSVVSTAKVIILAVENYHHTGFGIGDPIRCTIIASGSESWQDNHGIVLIDPNVPKYSKSNINQEGYNSMYKNHPSYMLIPLAKDSSDYRQKIYLSFGYRANFFGPKIGIIILNPNGNAITIWPDISDHDNLILDTGDGIDMSKIKP